MEESKRWHVKEASIAELLHYSKSEREGVCDTVLRLLPGERDVLVCSFFLARLKVLQDTINNFTYNHPPTTKRLSGNRRVACVFFLEIEDEDQEIFLHLIECLHKPEEDVARYVAYQVHSQGHVLPLLEMALSYDYTSLANICRNEMGFLVRELLDDNFSEALDIVEMLANWRPTAHGEDGSFQCKSGEQLRRHPVIRQCMHYLRAVPSKQLKDCIGDLSKLPSVVLIHLIIFAGLDYLQKQHIFARALRHRASVLWSKFRQNRQNDFNEARDREKGMDWDKAIVNFAASSDEDIISGILAQWSQTHRPLTRSLSANSRSTRLSKLEQAVIETRRRAESMPRPGVYQSNTDESQMGTHDDAMDIDDSISSQPSKTSHEVRLSLGSFFDFGATARLEPLPISNHSTMDTSFVISTCRELAKNINGGYCEEPICFSLPKHLLDVLPVGRDAAFCMSLSTMGYNNTQLGLCGTITHQSLFSNIKASLVIDMDTDPYLDEACPPLGEPKPLSVTFGHSFLTLATKRIVSPYGLSSIEIQRARRPSTLKVAVNIKINFIVDHR